MKHFYLLVFFCLASGTFLAAQNTIDYTLYLVGNAGNDTLHSMPVLKLVSKELEQSESSKTGVVFLGDNIYPEGMHKKESKYRKQDETRINAQLDVVKNFEGNIVFLTGNHDWNKFNPGGLKAVKRQEKYIRKYLDKKNILLPKHGCPGPEIIKLTPGVVMIVINTQWWLHRFERASGLKDGCNCRTENELMALFKDALKKYRNQHIIVAAHHPLLSNGVHGGHFRLKDHIFPLTNINSNAYVPLPVVGSLYPLYRRHIGHNQDIANPVYQEMANQIADALYQYDNMVYVAGHEHNLQYHHKNTIHHINSGSGSNVSHIIKNSKLDFGAALKGYVKLQYYSNGSVCMEFVSAEPGTQNPLFRKKLYNRQVIKNKQQPGTKKRSYKNMFATVVPDSTFTASKTKRFFFGNLNRNIWTTPLTVPYLDIHYEAGGLKPVKKGGGQQTISLRMQGANGKEYSLRGIKKNSTFLIERELRGTIAQDIIYDGMAGSHPYASVALSGMADASGILYPKSKLVFVPEDSVLGDYLDEFGGMFCLFEERPNHDMSESENFGFSKDVINYSDAIENLQHKYLHVVDKNYMVKARLFDMLIGDWDRHDDQWRWATFKEGKYTYYRAIPRDRDQAFFQFNGVIPSILNRKWLMRKFQHFDTNIRDVAGLCFNARYFDRAFLTEAGKQEWLQQATLLQQTLTDEVIENSIKQLPHEGFAINGEQIIATLKARRNSLPDFALEYYNLLAKTVSIPGTLNNDFFDVHRNHDGSVELNIYPRTENGKKQKDQRFFHRTFHPGETHEIRLYGLDGNDEYQIDGTCTSGILVRIIAGGKKDKIEDKSAVKGLRKHTLVYDVEGSKKLETNGETRVKNKPETDAYDYDRKDFVYNNLMPQVSVGFNRDDGFYFGPGFKYTAHGFKKEPYKYFHQLLVNRAFGINGYNMYYKFEYTNLVGNLNLNGKIKINLPDIFKYYQNVDNPDYKDPKYNVLLNNYSYGLALTQTSDDGAQEFSFGTIFQHVNFVKLPANLPPNWETSTQTFLAPFIKYNYFNADNKVNPHRGMHFSANAVWNNSLNVNKANYLQLTSELGFYIPIHLSKKQTTLALRSGYAGNFGNYTFYQANYVDPRNNFRGVKRNWLSARSLLFQNIELRQSLVKIPNYIVPFDLGMLAHTDFLHMHNVSGNLKNTNVSYGFGVFVNILDVLMLNGTYSVSQQDQMLNVGAGFLF